MVRKIWRLRIFPVLIALDQLCKTILWGGNPDLTISDYVGRKYPNTLLEKIINMIFWWDKDHCKESYEDGEQLWH